MLEIRLARIDDGPELARLRWEHAAEGSQDLMPFPEFRVDFMDFLASALESGRWGIWVADVDDRLLGTVSVHLIERAPRPVRSYRWKAYVTSAYVEAPVRNRGIGRALLDAAVTWARQHGAGSCIVWPSRRSVPFYTRAGFVGTTALELPAEPT
jgi:GNAT superfamily N-acetyltransferase